MCSAERQARAEAEGRRSCDGGRNRGERKVTGESDTMFHALRSHEATVGGSDPEVDKRLMVSHRWGGTPCPNASTVRWHACGLCEESDGRAKSPATTRSEQPRDGGAGAVCDDGGGQGHCEPVGDGADFGGEAGIRFQGHLLPWPRSRAWRAADGVSQAQSVVLDSPWSSLIGRAKSRCARVHCGARWSGCQGFAELASWLPSARGRAGANAST